ncbi:choline monooxygenase, chloroplastic-like [Hevea brasiliensis]|uniref:choline monooxygenase, chloroplastic-like n=1 Tax=Hevea brasiliensis TaxID=3981 RepID=UPI0025EAA824|nr:choline monooxygenase, chloroplastic-like [Hevea brasiliensis]
MTKLSLKGVVDSERVQIEDIMLCEGVQSGLESPEYCSGRCAPTVEKAMHHFHQLLHDNLKITGILKYLNNIWID